MSLHTETKLNLVGICLFKNPQKKFKNGENYKYKQKKQNKNLYIYNMYQKWSVSTMQHNVLQLQIVLY